MGLIVLIGLPGSGKTTFCKSIGEGESAWWFTETKNDLIKESYMRSGSLVPSKISFSILKDSIECNEQE